jgi:hypothetical protein
MTAASSPVAIQALDADMVRRDEHESGGGAMLRRHGRPVPTRSTGGVRRVEQLRQGGHGRVDRLRQARHVVQRWPTGGGYQTGNREELRLISEGVSGSGGRDPNRRFSLWTLCSLSVDFAQFI